MQFHTRRVTLFYTDHLLEVLWDIFLSCHHCLEFCHCNKTVVAGYSRPVNEEP